MNADDGHGGSDAIAGPGDSLVPVPPGAAELLLENAADALLLYRHDGVVLWASPALERMLGWRPRDVVGTPFRAAPEEDRESSRQAVLDALRRGDPGVEVRSRARCADGSLRWIETRARFLHDAEGRFTGSVASIRDVTREVEAEDRYRLVAEHSSDVVYVRDANGVITWVSPSSREMLGIEPELLVGTRTLDLVHPEDFPIAIAVQAQISVGGSPQGVVSRIRRGDGTYRYMSLASRPLQDAEGRALGAVGGLRDVDDLVRARQRAQAAEALLRASADGMFDPQVLMTAVRDDRGRVVGFVYAEVNRATCEYMGMSRQELVGSRVLATLPGLAEAGLFGRYVQALETGDPVVVDGVAYDNELLGGRRWYDIRGTRVGDAISLTWRDVTARHEESEALETAMQRYRLLAENASDVVYLRDPTGIVQWVSPSVTAVLGWDPQDLVGRDTIDFVHPDDVVLLREIRARVGAEERVSGMLFRIRCADGTYRSMSVATQGVVGPGGAVTGASVGLRDVHDLVLAERRAEEGERRLRTILDAQLDPHVVMHPVRDDEGSIVDFRFVDANPAALAYNGVTRDELVGHRMLELFPGHAGAGLLAAYAGVADSGEPLAMDDVQFANELLADVRWYDIRAVRVGGDVSVTWRDVTDRHVAGETLAASEERYRMLAENVTDVVIHVRDGIVVWVSPSVATVFGGTAAGWIGYDLMDALHPDDLPVYADVLRRVEAGESVVARGRFLAAEGVYRWVDAHVRTYVGADGTPDGIIATYRVVDGPLDDATEPP